MCVARVPLLYTRGKKRQTFLRCVIKEFMNWQVTNHCLNIVIYDGDT